MDGWTRGLGRMAFVLVVLTLSIAAAARGATPVAIGDGRQPAVAVDAAGTAYISWIGPESLNTSLHFCRLPRGATACAVSSTIATPGDSLTRPFVQVEGNVVRVLSYRYGLTGDRFDADFLFTSTDAGATFDAGIPVGTTPFYDAVSGPGAGISLATHAVTGGEFYQRVPTDGTSAGESRALLSTTHLYVGAVALLDANTPLVVYADGSGNAQFRRYAGAGDPNDAANWTPAQDIGVADWAHVTSGPIGLFLLATDSNRAVHVRKYAGGSGFGAPVAIPGASGESPQDYIVQDPAGRLHVLLPQITAQGSRLFYATSDNGTAWQTTQFAFEPFAAQVRAAVAADHRGVAVWESAGPARVFALPIGPAAAKPIFTLPRRPPATARRRGASVLVAVKGRLPVPSGASAAEACRGKLAVQVKRRRTKVAARTIGLKPTCAFATNLRFAYTKLRGTRRLRLLLSFRGNTAIGAAKRTYTLRVR